MKNKYVVITGAAKGIGRATVAQLTKEGYTVFAGVRTVADGEALQAEWGERLIPLLLEITDEKQLAGAVAAVEAVVGEHGLTGLVNNAGIAVGGPLEIIPLAELRNQLEVNVIGQVAVTQAFLPLLRRAKGRVINMSSIAGRVAGPLVGPYSVSKFALEAMTDVLRCELAPWGIHVICIEPGVIATPIWETSVAHAKQMIETLPPSAHALYGDKMASGIEQTLRNSAYSTPPQRVAKVVAKALAAKRPRTRYQVGWDARVVINLFARLPDRWRDWLMSRRSYRH